MPEQCTLSEANLKLNVIVDCFKLFKIIYSYISAPSSSTNVNSNSRNFIDQIIINKIYEINLNCSKVNNLFNNLNVNWCRTNCKSSDQLNNYINNCIDINCIKYNIYVETQKQNMGVEGGETVSVDPWINTNSVYRRENSKNIVLGKHIQNDRDDLSTVCQREPSAQNGYGQHVCASSSLIPSTNEAEQIAVAFGIELGSQTADLFIQDILYDPCKREAS